MAEHNKLGRKGEEAAARHLTSNGHQLLERNWRFQGYEIDIISLHGEYIVFTEVKTRASTEWGYPRGVRSTGNDAAHGFGLPHLRENEPGWITPVSV